MNTKNNKNTLKMAMSIALLSFFAPSAFSAGVVEIPKEAETVAEAKEILASPTLGDNSAYTLSETAEGEFVVSKYILNTETGELTKVDYSVNVNAQGDSSETAHYFKWSEDEAGNRILVATGSSTDADITAYANDDTTRLDTGDTTTTTTFYYNKIEDVESSTEEETAYTYTKVYYTETKGDITNYFVWNDESSTYEESNESDVENLSYDDTFTAKNSSAIDPYTANSINNDFVGLTKNITTAGDNYGGALFNAESVTIKSIEGDFIGNSLNLTQSLGISSIADYDFAYGGAIANMGDIDIITGNFVGNGAVSNLGYASGGAIYSVGNIDSSNSIEKITGDFIGNYVQSDTSLTQGGAIYLSYSEIDYILGDFIGNYSTTATLSVSSNGGAIRMINGSEIVYIEGDFIENYAASYGSSNGGAISATGSITSINGDFIGNYTKATYSFSYGGAISLSGTNAYIGTITGNFIDNSVTARSSSNGGAIYLSSASMGDIIGCFSENSTTSTNSSAYGGALYLSNSSIDLITGSFSSNFVNAKTNAYGGAIYLQSSAFIEEIDGDFKANSAQATSSAKGGAIYIADSDSEIETITANFIGNYAESTGSNAEGGAIYLDGASIGSIEGDFSKNSALAQSTGTSVAGGAIYITGSDSKINSITGNFTGNYAETTGSSTANGGAFYLLSGSIGSIYGSFEDNYTYSSSSNAYGGAIYMTGSIGLIEGDFINNSVEGSAYVGGGAIYLTSTASIDSIIGDFIGNSATSTSNTVYAGAIHNNGGKISITGDFIGNYATSTSTIVNGGAIYNTGTMTIEGDFIGNYAYTESGYVNGGAIRNGDTINFLATTDDTEFTGNYTQKGTTITSNAIYNTGTLNFSSSNGYSIIVNDRITGSSGTINILAGTVEFNNAVSGNTEINISGGTLSLGVYAGTSDLYGDGSNVSVDSSTASITGATLTVKNGATLNIATSGVSFASTSSLSLESGSTLLFDAFSSVTLSTATISDFLAEIIVDFSGYEIGTYDSYTLFTVSDSTNYGTIYNYLLSENFTVIIDDGIEATWTVSEASSTKINLTVELSASTAVPEPSTYAMIVGLAALGFVAYRRRK